MLEEGATTEIPLATLGLGGRSEVERLLRHAESIQTSVQALPRQVEDVPRYVPSLSPTHTPIVNRPFSSERLLTRQNNSNGFFRQPSTYSPTMVQLPYPRPAHSIRSVHSPIRRRRRPGILCRLGRRRNPDIRLFSPAGLGGCDSQQGRICVETVDC